MSDLFLVGLLILGLWVLYELGGAWGRWECTWHKWIVERKSDGTSTLRCVDCGKEVNSG